MKPSNHDLIQEYQKETEEDVTARRALEEDFALSLPEDELFEDGFWDDDLDFPEEQESYDRYDISQEDLWDDDFDAISPQRETVSAHYEKLWKECGY